MFEISYGMQSILKSRIGGGVRESNTIIWNWNILFHFEENSLMNLDLGSY